MSKSNLQDCYVHIFRLVHTSDDWISPLLKAAESSSYEEARYSPAPGVASIWEIVAHVSGWLEDLLHDVTGSPDAGTVDWPPISADTPSAWLATRQHLKSLVLSLQDVLARSTDEQLLATPAGTDTPLNRRIASIMVHNAYHAGQIVKLRQLYQAANSFDLEATGAMNG